MTDIDNDLDRAEWRLQLDGVCGGSGLWFYSEEIDATTRRIVQGTYGPDHCAGASAHTTATTYDVSTVSGWLDFEVEMAALESLPEWDDDDAIDLD